MWKVVWNALIDVYRNVHQTHLKLEEIQLQAWFPSECNSITLDVLGLVTSTPNIDSIGGLARKVAEIHIKNWFQEPVSDLKDSSDGKGSSEGLNP